MKRYRVLVCINVEARDDAEAEDRILSLMRLSPAMGRPDRDWYVDSIEEDVEEDDGESRLRDMEQAADEHAAGLPFGGSR